MDSEILAHDLSSLTGIEALAQSLVPAMRQAKRFNDFINFTIDDFSEEGDTEVLPHIY